MDKHEVDTMIQRPPVVVGIDAPLKIPMPNISLTATVESQSAAPTSGGLKYFHHRAFSYHLEIVLRLEMPDSPK